MKTKAVSVLLSFVILFSALCPISSFGAQPCGFAVDESKTVYAVDENGERLAVSGEFTIEENNYTLSNGVPVTVNNQETAQITIDNKVYLINKGILFTGLYKKQYYNDGVWDKSVNGYRECDGKNYYFTDGALATAVIKSKSGSTNGKYIYIKNGLFNSKSGMITVNGNTYYLSKGIAQSGLKKVKKKKYFFSKKNCRLVRSKDVKAGKKWYVANKKGELHEKHKAFVKAASIIKKQTDADDTKTEKLFKCYEWTVTKCSYSVKKGYVEPNGKKWVNKYAYNMLTTRRGRCYSFAAAFAVLAKELGYKDVRVMRGKCGRRSYNTHSWVEIDINGETRVFDPEFETHFRNKVEVHDIFFNQTYEKTPANYKIKSSIKVKK